MAVVVVSVRSWALSRHPIRRVQTPRAASFLVHEMAEPSWQEQLRLRLAERNNKESAFSSIIEQCKPLILPPTNFIQFDLRRSQVSSTN